MRFVFMCASTLAAIYVFATRRRARSFRLLGAQGKRQVDQLAIMEAAQRQINIKSAILNADVEELLQLSDAVSLSSQSFAAYRALESRNPDGLFYDPLAEKLAGPKAMQVVAERGEEAVTRFAVRTRWIDDALRSSIKRTLDEPILSPAASEERRRRQSELLHEIAEELSAVSVADENGNEISTESSIYVSPSENEAVSHGSVIAAAESDEATVSESRANGRHQEVEKDKPAATSSDEEPTTRMDTSGNDVACDVNSSSDKRTAARVAALLEVEHANSIGRQKKNGMIDNSPSSHEVVTGDVSDWYSGGPIGRQVSESLARKPGRSECQIVILGAGMDARAWRLLGQATSANSTMASVIFEVDRAEVIAAKELILAKVAAEGKLPVLQLAERRVAVAADLQSDSWYAALRSAGFEVGKPTVWLMEGLLMYLKEDNVLVMMNIITMASSPGSSIVATGVSEEGVRKGRSSTSSLMREWKWGCNDPEAFFSSLGWRIADSSDPYTSSLQWERTVSRRPAEAGKPKGTWYIYAML